MIMDMVGDKNQKDNCGTTPLHTAALNGHSEIVKIILDVVEDKNPKGPCGQTPLHYAANNSHTTICEIILPLIDNKNSKDMNGNTPMSILAKIRGNLATHQEFFKPAKQVPVVEFE